MFSFIYGLARASAYRTLDAKSISQIDQRDSSSRGPPVAILCYFVLL